MTCSVFFLRTWRFAALMAAASVTPPGSLDLLQPGFSKTLLGTKPEDKYLCSACKNVLRRPFQAQCGHRYCSYCLTSILRYCGWLAGSGVHLGAVPSREAAPGKHASAGDVLRGCSLMAEVCCQREREVSNQRGWVDWALWTPAGEVK